MDVASLAVAAALVWKLVTAVKAALAGDKGTLVTQVLVWGVGIGVAFLLAASDFASGIEVQGHTLGSLNAASTVLFGISLGSVASVGYDVKKSLDDKDSAAEPRLFSNAPGA